MTSSSSRSSQRGGRVDAVVLWVCVVYPHSLLLFSADLPLRSAITLGTLAWFTLAAPLAHLDRPSGEPSGAGQGLEAEGLLCDSPVWGLFIASTTRHRKQVSAPDGSTVLPWNVVLVLVGSL